MISITTLKKHSTFIIVGTIIVLGILAYANALPNKFLYDDNDGIVNNIYIKDWHYFPNYFSENLTAGAGVVSNYWRPVLLITYSIEWHLWKDWVPGYHAVNILMHIADAILIFFILFHLFSLQGPAAIAALLFTIHPLQTEAITYISGLGDPLSLFFILVGTYFFLKVRGVLSSTKGNNLLLNYAIIVVVFLLALMTKERSVVFPAVLLLIDFFIWKTRELSILPFWNFIKLSFIRIAPFGAISLGYLMLRGTLLNFQNTFNIYTIPNYYTEHIAARIFTFLSIIPTYFSLIITPFGLHMERSNEIVIATTLFNPLVLLGTSILLTIGLLAIYALEKHPAYTFGVLWFLFMIFPSSGIAAPVAGIIYEHYLYAPLIGIALLIGLAGCALYNYVSNRAMQALLIGTFLVTVVFLSVQTTLQNKVNWKDQKTFYINTLRYVPRSLQMRNNLGLLYASQGNFQKAEETYRLAILYTPSSPLPHHNLGNLLYQTGRLDEAIKEYEKAITISPRSSLPYQALYHLYLDKNELTKANEVMKQLQLLSE
ncbi:MAG: tetratricopeptide repeat protein [Candidatus Paceibacterota bacterium]|jgi:hypothetical protein